MTLQKMNKAITLLDENKMLGIDVVFEIDCDFPRVRLDFHIETYRNSLGFMHELRNVDEWNRLGRAIGRSSSLHEINLQGTMHRINNRSTESDQCMEAIYRGIEMNSSIETFDINMDLFQDEETLPTLNLNNVQFKTSLKSFTLSKSIKENWSHMISSFMENVTLEILNLDDVDVDETSESAFRRVVLACTNVKKLDVYCDSASHYSAVASLLENPRSVLSEIEFIGGVDEEGLSTIASGLANNTTLKTLDIEVYDLSFECSNPIAKALCDASSIEGIHRSNHTLQEMNPALLETLHDLEEFDMVSDCLKNNKNANKQEVIRKKIARYYFIGDYDMSPFADMPVTLIPEVLSLIEGEDINRQYAIFQMLKCIPELCNVSSRLSGRTDGRKGSNSSCKNAQGLANKI